MCLVILKMYLLSSIKKKKSFTFSGFSRVLPDDRENLNLSVANRSFSVLCKSRNIKPSVFRMDLSAVCQYDRTSGFIFFRIDSPTSTSY